MLWCLLTALTYGALLLLGALLFLGLGAGVIAERRRAARPVSLPRGAAATAVGFFHPYCNAGGGGERVLWCAINALHARHAALHCVVYTGDVDAAPEDILHTARSRFGLALDASRIHFVFLRQRGLVEAAAWPRFTMLGQSLGSLALGYEALCQFAPAVFLDTMGYAFTLPMFALLGGCQVGCYVHYPTISTDMLRRVRQRDAAFNNDEAIARSSALSFAKWVYYVLFAKLYGVAGRFSRCTMVNSSWTRAHVVALWGDGVGATVVFPPCDTANLQQLPIARPSAGGRTVLSVAQFRPEKNHALQLSAFALLLQQHPGYRSGAQRVRLILAGGCRNEGDRSRVQQLRKQALELGLVVQDDDAAGDGWDVAFRLNVPYSELQRLLSTATAGIHTMRDEHFGIGVVEFMAAGAVALAHDSAGPRMDIVTPVDGKQSGFLASSAEQYASAMHAILAMPVADRDSMAARGRHGVSTRFSEEAFGREFCEALAASGIGL